MGRACRTTLARSRERKGPARRRIVPATSAGRLRAAAEYPTLATRARDTPKNIVGVAYRGMAFRPIVKLVLGKLFDVFDHEAAQGNLLAFHLKP